MELIVWWTLFVMRGIKTNYAREIESNSCSSSPSAVMLEMSMVMRETAFSRWLQRTQALCWPQPTITECKPQQDCGVSDATVIILKQVKVILCGYELLMAQWNYYTNEAVTLWLKIAAGTVIIFTETWYFMTMNCWWNSASFRRDKPDIVSVYIAEYITVKYNAVILF